MAGLKKKMINYIMKKKENEDSGYHKFMRVRKVTPQRMNKIVSHDQIKKLSSYQSEDPRKDPRKRRSVESRNKVRTESGDVVERKSNSSKFKSVNEYFNRRYKTDSNTEVISK